MYLPVSPLLFCGIIVLQMGLLELRFCFIGLFAAQVKNIRLFTL